MMQRAGSSTNLKRNFRPVTVHGLKIPHGAPFGDIGDAAGALNAETTSRPQQLGHLAT
jgi:hypothetical protein